jgi:hypothetical protein
VPERLASIVRNTRTRTSPVTDSIAGQGNALQRLLPADPAVSYPGWTRYERFRNAGLAIAPELLAGRPAGDGCRPGDKHSQSNCSQKTQICSIEYLHSAPPRCGKYTLFIIFPLLFWKYTLSRRFEFRSDFKCVCLINLRILYGKLKNDYSQSLPNVKQKILNPGRFFIIFGPVVKFER